ncbi:MAG: hypothetical protein ACTSPB_03955 [Candidatus Thorarchaeota archaeon]
MKSLELVQEIENSIGFQARRNKIILNIYYDIFLDNSHDLVATIIEKEELWKSGELDYQSHLKEIMGEDAFDIEGRDWFHDKIYREIFRGLHNYLASCFSLRDCIGKRVRPFIEQYTDMEEYDEMKRRAFTENPIRAFIQELRNKWLHQGGLLPVYTMGLDRVELENGDSIINRRCEVNFSKRILLERYQWGPLETAYISTWEEKKKLIKIISEYDQIVEDHYQWLLGFWDSIFIDEYIKTDKLREKRLSIIEKK